MKTILSRTIEEGLSELERPSDGLFLSALTAELETGTGLFLTAIVWPLQLGCTPSRRGSSSSRWRTQGATCSSRSVGPLYRAHDPRRASGARSALLARRSRTAPGARPRR
ncbi:hypothetical protein BRC77_11685 [Halobacteriales archaeon QH_8_64_26]|nr:MAG: hypothetical protein BRC77_11685 [Halobacteriales archaeon QH_8_64_26]